VRADFSPDAATDRYSIALFCYADFDAAIDIGDTHTSGAYILSKLKATQATGTVAPGVVGAQAPQRAVREQTA
jgi:hypothetical protein